INGAVKVEVVVPVFPAKTLLNIEANLSIEETKRVHLLLLEWWRRRGRFCVDQLLSCESRDSPDKHEDQEEDRNFSNLCEDFDSDFYHQGTANTKIAKTYASFF